MTVTTVREQYRSLTESALEALSSKGLVRRAAADLAGGKVRLAAETASEIEIEADGETVRLDGRGPLQARCSCRAPSMCRHRLAAMLLLRSEEASPAMVSQAPAPTARPWTDILAEMSPEQLERWAGRAALRQAIELIATATDAIVVEEGASLRVRLDQKTPEIVIMASGGFDAIASTTPARKKKPAHAAAVLVARRQLGLALPAMAATSPESEEPSAIDPGFIGAVRSTLEQCFSTGFAIAPRTLQERLLSLGVSGRGQAMPRLAGLMREIAARIEERRNRDPDHDSRALLAKIATAYALSSALASAPNGASRASLAGISRRSYESVGDLRLHGVGAELWETASGARGVTAHFYDAAGSQWYSATLSRPNTYDVSFDPVAAFVNEPVWGSTLDRLTVGIVTLTGARASEGGRLSLGRETRAVVAPWTPTAEDVLGWCWAFTDWNRLGVVLGQYLAARQATGGGQAIPVILKPSRFGPAAFEDISQSLIWPLADENGAWIGLRLAHEGLMAARLEHLERRLTAIRPWAVLATAELAGEIIEISPFGLWAGDRVLLDFPPRAEPAAKPGAVERILASLRQATDAIQRRRFIRAVPQQDHTGRLMVETLDELVRAAEMSGALAAHRRDSLGSLAGRFRTAGLEPIARQLDAIDASPENGRAAACLRAAYAVGSFQHLRVRMPYLMETTSSAT